MWLLVKNLWICFSNLFHLMTFSYKMAFDATTVANSFFLCFSFLNFYQSITLLNLSETPLIVCVSCLVPWLNHIFHLHHNFFYNNCPHTNSINNWSMWKLSETTRVWKDNCKLLKSVNAKFSLKSLMINACWLICNCPKFVNLHWSGFLQLVEL
jgi:hypothetical protein